MTEEENEQRERLWARLRNRKKPSMEELRMHLLPPYSFDEAAISAIETHRIPVRYISASDLRFERATISQDGVSWLRRSAWRLARKTDAQGIRLSDEGDRRAIELLLDLAASPRYADSESIR